MAGIRVGAVMVAVFACLVAIAHAQAPQLVADVAVTDNRYTPSASTVSIGGTVKFAYDAGEEVHNVEFSSAAVTCTTTKGARTGASGKQVPFTSEGPGWQGNCTFPGPGVYRFICVDHSEMDGRVTVLNADGSVPVEATPTPTPTPTPQAGTDNPPAAGGPADSGTVTAPKLTIAASQRGQAVAGSIKGGSATASVVVETLAPLKARAKPTRVGRATYAVAAGATKKFNLALSAKGKAALKKLGRLKVTVRFTVAGATTTKTVTLRPAAKAKSSIAQKAVTVQVGDNWFSPKTATVARGGTVTWRWVGKKSHDVSGPGFKSKLIKTGTYKRAFSKKGTFKYVCTVHRGMTGTVRVK
ncbi:plastocyanin/azurin family copper-binding protein [Solirubrobacter taibaiensis]|nr:plastocyanin/azurin family copper-binding protein [Solirubrobacter taibaiensis]